MMQIKTIITLIEEMKEEIPRLGTRSGTSINTCYSFYREYQEEKQTKEWSHRMDRKNRDLGNIVWTGRRWKQKKSTINNKRKSRYETRNYVWSKSIKKSKKKDMVELTTIGELENNSMREDSSSSEEETKELKIKKKTKDEY